MPPAHLSFQECFDVIATGTASVQNAFAQALSQVSRTLACTTRARRRVICTRDRRDITTHRDHAKKALAYSVTALFCRVPTIHCTQLAATSNAGAGMPGAGGEDVGFGVPHSHKTTPGGGVAAQGY